MKKRKPLLPELNSEELNIILPKLVKLFKTQTNDLKHITADRIVDFFRFKKDILGYKGSFTKQRFMKLTNYIRVMGLLPLISGPTGYFFTRDKETIREMIESFKQRVESQLAAIKGLENILSEIEEEGDDDLFDSL